MCAAMPTIITIATAEPAAATSCLLTARTDPSISYLVLQRLPQRLVLLKVCHRVQATLEKHTR